MMITREEIKEEEEEVIVEDGDEEEVIMVISIISLRGRIRIRRNMLLRIDLTLWIC